MLTPAAILVLLIALYIAFRADCSRTRVRRKEKRGWPSAIRPVKKKESGLDEMETKISE